MVVNKPVSRHIARHIRIKPVQYVITFFMAFIIVGTILLLIPGSSRNAEGIGVVQAFFTSTSAVCVTGLVVADTYTEWTLFGQIVILCLIQIGGLGIMTAATMFSIALRRTITLRERLIMAESLNQYSIQGLVLLVKRIILGTFVIESVGTILLSIRFIPQYGLSNGLFRSIFHSISAFCNAGFDIMGNKGPFSSFISYNTDPLVCITLMVLIIAGGTGFAVWSDLLSSKKFSRLFLHTKLVVTVTSALILTGFISFLLLEYNNPLTMGNMTFWQKIMASFFQSVTTRTAGFNTIDQNSMTGASKFLSMFLMFIGGSPGSTAGGIKTTTAGILLFNAISVWRERSDTELFGKRVSDMTAKKALSIFFAGVMVVSILSFVLQITEKLTMESILYEAFSAFGTVGLSTGITPGLSNAGRIAVAIAMYCGRVGVLTMGLALASSVTDNTVKYRFSEDKVMLG